MAAGHCTITKDTVRCPWHHACFSLRTGEPVLEAVALDLHIEPVGKGGRAEPRRWPGLLIEGLQPALGVLAVVSLLLAVGTLVAVPRTAPALDITEG